MSHCWRWHLGRHRFQIGQLQIEHEVCAGRIHRRRGLGSGLVECCGEHGEVNLLGHLWRSAGDFGRLFGHMVRDFGGLEVRHRQFVFERLGRNGHRRHGRLRCGLLCNVCHCRGQNGLQGGSATRGHGQRHQCAVQTHGVGRSTERLGVPARRPACSDVIGPAAEGMQGVSRQLQQARLHGLLFGEPDVEHLLHRPSGFAKVVQPHHARTALERMERAAQGGLLAQVTGFSPQLLDGSQTVHHHFARLFEEHVEQFVFHIGHCGGRSGGHRGRRLSWCRGHHGRSRNVKRNVRGQAGGLSRHASIGRRGRIKIRERRKVRGLAGRLLHREPGNHVGHHGG